MNCDNYVLPSLPPMPNGFKEKLERVVKTYIQNSEKYGINHIYLYGDCATGHSDIYSDLDLLVSVDSTNYKDMVMPQYCFKEYDRPYINYMPASTGLKKSDNSVRRTIDNEKILLWER